VNPIHQIRAWLTRTSPDRRDREIGGYPELTRRNLRAVLIMAEAFEREHPDRAKVIMFGQPQVDKVSHTD
jgi:hypothetical protein